MNKKHMLTLLALLFMLALMLPTALAEEVAAAPVELEVGEAQEGVLWTEDMAEVPAVQEQAVSAGIEDYWTKEQFDAWYEGEKESAKSADHLLGPGGDMFANRITAIFPGETVAVVPNDAEVSDSALAKYGNLIFGFTIYQLDNPIVETEYSGINLLPRTGTPEKTALTVKEKKKLNVPYRAAATFSGVDAGSIAEVEYVSLYQNDTGHPILFYRNEFEKSDSAGSMNGLGENKLGRYVMTGSGTIYSRPTFYFVEDYYELNYSYGDAKQSEISFPAGAPDKYADRIYIDKEDHTYQLPRPIRKGHLFNEWDNRNDWHWGWLASHSYPTQEDPSWKSVSAMTDDAYTHTINFQTILTNAEESTFYALKDVTLEAKFIAPSYYYPSCMTVGFDPRGGTVNGQKSLVCETVGLKGTDFTLDIGKVVPVREGYKFKGWCTNPKDEAGTLIKDTSPEKAGEWAKNEHTELYAVWESATTKSIAKAKVAAIKAQTYTGKAIKPALKVTLGGVTLKKGADYTVSYAKNKAIGKATVTITGKGSYTGKKTATFSINPKATALSSLTVGKGKLTVKWKKAAGGAGYQIQYSLKKSFASAKTVTIARNATVKTVLDKLTSGKTYYVRVRAYRKIGGATYASAWSKALYKKVK